MPVEEVQRLIHELHVHQIELEMQNEELRRTQEDLRSARDDYFDLFNLAPVGYLKLSDKGVILDANLAAAGLLGFEQQRLKRLHLTDFIYREDQDIFYLQRKQALQENNPHAFELRLVHQGGQVIDVQMECVRIEGHSQPAGQMRVMLSDISERKRQEQDLKRSLERLAITNRRLEDFASMASHDLQEPARKIKAFGNLVSREYGHLLDEKGQDYIERMRHAADRMEKLIVDLLAFSKLSTYKPNFQAVDLTQVLHEVMGDLENQVKQTQAQVKVGALPTLMAEPTLMAQLFQNLLSNALKYHQPGIPPLIMIEAEQLDSNQVEIRIADNGIGFNQQDAGKIFSPFVRLHGRNEYEGTGIGLAICLRIVENHSGAISARSAPGQGATFIVHLPLQQPAAEG
jgi:PAS domain S-box-containing protein